MTYRCWYCGRKLRVTDTDIVSTTSTWKMLTCDAHDNCVVHFAIIEDYSKAKETTYIDWVQIIYKTEKYYWYVVAYKDKNFKTTLFYDCDAMQRKKLHIPGMNIIGTLPEETCQRIKKLLLFS